MNNTTVKNRPLPILLHSMAWLVLIILPQIIINRFWGNNNFISWGFYFGAAMYGLIFYINYLWLVPKYYFRPQKITYFALAAVVIIVLYTLFIIVNKNFFHDPEKEKMIHEAFEKLMKDNVVPRPPMKQLQVYYFALISVIVTGFSIGLRVIEKHTESEKRQKELEKEKLNSELAFLKNQVSPHFFFNTLNNIYSLIEINKTDAQDAVMKLSRLMRYLLYESEHSMTPLSHEVNFMKHYIDLMRLRISPKVELKIDLPENDNGLKVPPLLFIPFIENAFKHGISYREKSFIDIAMQTENNRILFVCRNSVTSGTVASPEENHSGIGLENVKKRLKLLFAGKHELKITKTENEFEVDLKIEVEKEN
jgi:two-component system, LytTR family, sensor kinase